MTLDPAYKLSIVCPLHEDEEGLPRFHFELVAALAGLPPQCSVEILYVDDGSRDGTLSLLRHMASMDSSIQYLSLSRRFGLPAALTAGLEHAHGDAVITLDPTMPHPPGLLPVLLSKWREGYDVVLTQPADEPHRGCWQRLSSWAFRRLLSWLSAAPVHTGGSEYRLLARSAIDGLMQTPEAHRHLGGLVQWIGFRTTTVVLPSRPQQGGAAWTSVRRTFSLAFEEVLSFSKLPLRGSLVLGLLAALLGVGQGAWCAAQMLKREPGVPWVQEVLLLTVLLGGGIILGALGVLGEYVGRVYEQVKGRPLYLLKEASPPASTASTTVSWSVRERQIDWWQR